MSYKADRNKEKIAYQILHEGEIYLKETLNVADSLDRKAIIFAIFSMILFIFSIVMLHIEPSIFGFSIFGFSIIAIGFYLSFFFFIKALKPKRQYYLVGNHPKNLIEEMQKDEEYSASDFAIEESKNYQEMIERNSLSNSNKASYINLGLNIIFYTISLFFIIQLCQN